MFRRSTPALLALLFPASLGLVGCGAGDGSITACGGDRSLGAPVASASPDGCVIVDGDLLVQRTEAEDLAALAGLQHGRAHAQHWTASHMACARPYA